MCSATTIDPSTWPATTRSSGWRQVNGYRCGAVADSPTAGASRAGSEAVARGRGRTKTTLCVAQGPHAWLSQHVGDTVNLETLAMLARTADTLLDLQRVDPDAVVSDAHPDYLSTAWASRRAESTGVRHVTVQHHHAHFASLLTEHQVPPGEPVLGFIFDGTGYGTDGTIWGGEILLGSYSGVRRIGHLRPISLPGGTPQPATPGERHWRTCTPPD